MTIDETPRKLRWPRTHRFALSDRGRAAEGEYRADIVAARAEPGRASFESARSAWATRHGVTADDGLYLGELSGAPATLSQLVAALETCGKSRLDAVTALERLFDASMLA
jgi:hypothetical protein